MRQNNIKEILLFYASFFIISQSSNLLHAEYPKLVTLDPVEAIQETNYLNLNSLEINIENEAFLSPQTEALLDKQTGIDFAQRGIDSYEPIIRGLSRERIQISFNDIILIDSSPTQTSSPLSPLLNSQSSISIKHNNPSSLGSELKLELSPNQNGNLFHFQIDENRKGYSSRIDLQTQGKKTSTRTVTFSKNLNNYSAANGLEVPAKNSTHGISSVLEHHSKNSKYRIFALYCEQEEVINTSLPLDTLNSDWYLLGASGQYNKLNWLIGYSKSTPFLSNKNRPNITDQNTIEANSEAISSNGKLYYQFNEDTRAGISFWHQSRDTIRKRPTGTDYIWPDVYQNDFAFYLTRTFQANDLEIHLSSAVQYIESDAKLAHKNAFGTPINELYSEYNKTSSKDIANEDWAGSINLLLQKKLEKNHYYINLNAKRTSPGISQRYRAFLPALGGDGQGNPAFEVGNPYLDMENSSEILVGTKRLWSKGFIQAESYYRQINNYASRNIIGETKNSPPPPPGLIVYGFQEINAAIYGLEISSKIELNEYFSLHNKLGFIEGENLDQNTDLVEMPSHEAFLELQYKQKFFKYQILAALECQHTSGKNNPQPEQLPTYKNTSSYTLYGLKLKIQQEKHTIKLFVENLFDKEYYNYLQTPVYGEFLDGDLKSGDSIPGKGRSYYISYQFHF